MISTKKIIGGFGSNLLIIVTTMLCAQSSAISGELPRFASCQPLRPLPPASAKQAIAGPAKFVDATHGNDEADGSEQRPWRSINFAMRQLAAGETLYLRGGTYFENVYCSAVGRADAPICIRAYPGEQAILDGGIPEFFNSAQTAWEPSADGGYRSTKRYKGIRDVLGLFGDSLVGLQTYWHSSDLLADNELWIDDPQRKTMVAPVYCGPGLFYDKESGYIYCRLAHTNIRNDRVANYAGETDPRKLPLVIAPFNSVPLFVDQAMHVKFQDLVIRGGGFNTVVLQFGIDLEFDNVVVYGGTYCLRSRGTGPCKFMNSALHGMIPPWAFRSENGLYTYTGDAYDPWITGKQTENARNIARLPTHAVLVMEGSEEFEVFYYPYNHDWEISYCEFTDGHDGVYVNGQNMRFHHNLLDTFQDDALYLSSPTFWVSDDVRVYQNYLRSVSTAFGFHSYGGPDGHIYIYRNIVDMRDPRHFERPTPDKPEGGLFNAGITVKHGSEMIGTESVAWYQNTLIGPTQSAGFAHYLVYNTSEKTSRQVFNNLILYLNGPPSGLVPIEPHNVRCDGNLYWSLDPTKPMPEDFLARARKQIMPKSGPATTRPIEEHGIVANPQFMKFDLNPTATCDYRLTDQSPAAGAGVVLPKELEDPLRPDVGAAPDVGALQRGSPLSVGCYGRVHIAPVEDR